MIPRALCSVRLDQDVDGEGGLFFGDIVTLYRGMYYVITWIPTYIVQSICNL